MPVRTCTTSETCRSIDRVGFSGYAYDYDMARRASRQRPFWAGRRRRERVKRQMLPLGLPTPLRAVSSSIDSGAVRVLGSGDVAFQQIVERVRGASRSVEIRAFLWRDDEAGNMLGAGVLAAANPAATGATWWSGSGAPSTSRGGASGWPGSTSSTQRAASISWSTAARRTART